MHVRGLAWPLVLLLAAFAARRRLDVVAVRGRSMAPTLLPGDLLLVVRAARSPRVGDVVLAHDPRDARRELIKRVEAIGARGVRLAGDNAAGSTDARSFGPIAAEAVRWRVMARYWPPRRIGLISGLSRGRPPRGVRPPPTC